jgi:hypothetical protein
MFSRVMKAALTRNLPGRPAAGAIRDDVGGGDIAREIHRAAGNRRGFDARRLLHDPRHHPGQCRQGKEEGIGTAGGGGGDRALPRRAGPEGGGGPGTEADLSAARVLRP